MQGILFKICLVLVMGMSLQAQNIITWVPPYYLNESKDMLERDFGGVGMKDGLTHLALQFWVPDGPEVRKVRGYGDITDNHIQWFKEWGEQHGIKVMLCIYNAEDGWDWSAAVSSFVNNQDSFVNSILNEVDRLELDGVEIDLEGPGEGDTHKDEFVSFINKLSEDLRPRGKQVTVASFAYIWNAPNSNWWSDLTDKVDGITSMGYEEIGAGGNDWSSYTGQKELATDPDKLMIGMPGWVDSWKDRGVQSHLDWVENDGSTGVAIWDASLEGGGEWLSAETWETLSRIRKLVPVSTRKFYGKNFTEILKFTGSHVLLDLKKSGPLRVEVFSAQGKFLWRQSKDNVTAGVVKISLDYQGREFSPGIYVIIIKGNDISFQQLVFLEPAQ